MAPEADIQDNLRAVKTRVAEAATAAGRSPGDVTLVAIAKTHPPGVIRLAIAAGQRVFGENRVQEAEDKWPALKTEFSDLQLHLVGTLQRNKVKRAVQLFDVIETIDRPELARAIAREIESSGRRPKCFVQVNTGDEPQKRGVRPEDADAFITACRDEIGLEIDGLMCVPPLEDEPSLHFALLREIARRNGIGGLSMGMSGDFETAIQFGATHVRVGTAIFGERRAPAAVR
jgi:pyridoxal phosphate enzyme (YggS family)